MTVPYWHCTRNMHGWSMPKRQVPTLPLTSCSPDTSRRLQPALVAAACAGKRLSGSAPAAASGRLWVVTIRGRASSACGRLASVSSLTVWICRSRSAGEGR